MRWRFRSPSATAENRERARLEAAIDRWWAAFAKKASDIDALFQKRTQWDLPAWMAEHYEAIQDGLFWEFGPGLNGGHRLVMTPEVNRHLRPLVGEIIRRAPRLEGWELYAYRLPESLDMMHGTVEARSQGANIEGSLCHVAPGPQNIVDLTFFYPRFTDEEEDRGPFFVAVETLLGEEILDKWIGRIWVKPLAEAHDAVPLDRLADQVRRTIEQIRSGLPSTPCFQLPEDTDWSMFEMTPSEEPDEALGDYPRQDDMFVGKALRREMWQAAHSGGVFASERFSRVGETFCYVKLDGRQGLDEEKFADKSEIEDALDAALVPAGLGCHVGGGTGRWYSYVDLALTDVDKGIEVVRRVLSAGNIARRSWILFFDDEWAHEWVGIYDDSPPPLLVP